MHPDLVFILWKEMAETFKSLHLEQGLEHNDVALRNLLARNPEVDGTNNDRLFYVIDFDMAKPATQLGMVLDLFNLLSVGCKANSEKDCPAQLSPNDESTGAYYNKKGNLRVYIPSPKLGKHLGDKYCKFLENLRSEGYFVCENLVSMLKSNKLITDFPRKKEDQKTDLGGRRDPRGPALRRGRKLGDVKEKLTDDLKKKFGDVMTRWLSSINNFITGQSIDKEKEWEEYKNGRQHQRFRKSDEIEASEECHRAHSA